MSRDTAWRSLGLALVLLAAPPAAANGQHDGSGPEPATKFERLVVRECAPCLRETYAVAAVAAPPLKPSGFSAQLLSAMARSGEARFEVLRGARSGRTGEQFAMRVELFLAIGRPADVAGGPDATEIEYHAGSLRLGVLRTRAATVAYVQAGDPEILRAPSAADGLSALFWQPADLPALADAVNRVLARIAELRGK
jgi:hypothetical protein